MRHAKSRLVESRSEDPDISGDADESAPVRSDKSRPGLETASTGGANILKFLKIELEDARYHIPLLPLPSGMY